MTYAVGSDQRGTDELSWFVDREVNKALYGVPGVALVTRAGGVEREIRVFPEAGVRHHRLEALDPRRGAHRATCRPASLLTASVACFAVARSHTVSMRRTSDNNTSSGGID